MSPAGPLTFSIHDGVGQGLELFAMQLAVEACTGIARIRKRDLAALLDRPCRSDAQKRTFQLGSTRKRLAHGLVSLRSEQQRQRRCPLAQIGAGDLPGLDRDARAVEDVVGDLERDAEREPESTRAAGQPARSLEELARLQRATFEVRLDSGVRIEALGTLQGLAPRKA